MAVARIAITTKLIDRATPCNLNPSSGGTHSAATANLGQSPFWSA